MILGRGLASCFKLLVTSSIEIDVLVSSQCLYKLYVPDHLSFYNWTKLSTLTIVWLYFDWMCFVFFKYSLVLGKAMNKKSLYLQPFCDISFDLDQWFRLNLVNFCTRENFHMSPSESWRREILIWASLGAIYRIIYWIMKNRIKTNAPNLLLIFVTCFLVFAAFRYGIHFF